MWFEILPAYMIIVAAMAAPHASAYVLNYLVVGNVYRRDMCTLKQRMQYVRDRRLTGDPYKVNGLDSLPPYESVTCEEECKESREEDEDNCEEE